MRIPARILPALLLLATTALPAGAALSDHFVSTDWLARNRDKVTVVDVRVAPLYLIGHVEGAYHLDKSKFLFTRNTVQSLVPTADEFRSLMDAYGITPETTVVAYAEHDNPYAARFIWTLKYHGHANAFVLDGGYDKWSQEGRSTAILPSSPRPTLGYHCKAGMDIRAEADYILTRLNNPAALVWDTRKTEEFEGTMVRADRGGHIPGAVHLNWVNLTRDQDGIKVLKSEKEIRALLAKNGITAEREILAHCQTGIRSAYATLVLLGLDYRVRNYDGSWLEWANNHSLPIIQPLKLAAQ